jgi:hypothetical protein
MTGTWKVRVKLSIGSAGGGVLKMLSKSLGEAA